MGHDVPLDFWDGSQKKSSQKNKLLSQKKKVKKKKTLLQSYTPCLDSQSVKKNFCKAILSVFTASP